MNRLILMVSSSIFLTVVTLVMASKVLTIFLLYLFHAEQINSFTISKWKRYSLNGYLMEDYIGEEKRRSMADCMIKCNSYNTDCLIIGFNVLTRMCYIYNKFLYVTQNHTPDSNMKYFIKHQDNCPSPFVSAESRCVYICNTPKHPDVARTDCETLKSSLILLDTQNDLRFIKDNFPSLPGDFFLAAGSNRFAGDLNSFEWLNGEIIDAALFCPGEPDRDGKEKSVGISPADGFCLRDRVYANSQVFICELI